MRMGGRDNVNLTLIALTCALLMVLPLVTTFDDLLTAWAMQLGADNPLQAIVPIESRMVVSLLGLIGIHAAASAATLSSGMERARCMCSLSLGTASAGRA